MCDLAMVRSRLEIQAGEDLKPAYVVLTLVGRDIDGSRVTERHSYKNDLLISKQDIDDALSQLPRADVDCDRYSLPSISQYDPDDDEVVNQFADIIDVEMYYRVPRSVDGEDVLSSLIAAIDNSKLETFAPGIDVGAK